MRRNKLKVYLHFVWKTWDRQPLIAPGIERGLHRSIEGIAIKNGCSVLAIGGTEDHVHLFVKFPATVTMADLMRRVKGGSSNYANAELVEAGAFRWQGNYGAFSVSQRDKQRVIDYIMRQKEHHAAGAIWPEAEESFIDDEPESEATSVSA